MVPGIGEFGDRFFYNMTGGGAGSNDGSNRSAPDPGMAAAASLTLLPQQLQASTMGGAMSEATAGIFSSCSVGCGGCLSSSGLEAH